MPTTIAPPSTVVGAPRVALPFGLFSVVTFRTGDRWESGVQWETPSCDDPVGGIGAWLCPPDAVPGFPKELDPNGQSVGLASPFTVYGHYTCTAVGSWDNAQDLANQALLAGEQKRVEQALWTGDLGNEPYLADQDETTTLAGGTAVDLVSALALLEDYISGSYGNQGVIHMTRGLALTAATKDLVISTGAKLTTKIGTPVVAGGGYPGTGPDGSAPGANKSWAYSSPALFGYRSDVFDSDGPHLNRADNTLTALAERSYLLGFDPCGVGAVQVDTTV